MARVAIEGIVEFLHEVLAPCQALLELCSPHLSRLCGVGHAAAALSLHTGSRNSSRLRQPMSKRSCCRPFYTCLPSTWKCYELALPTLLCFVATRLMTALRAPLPLVVTDVNFQRPDCVLPLSSYGNPDTMSGLRVYSDAITHARAPLMAHYRTHKAMYSFRCVAVSPCLTEKND